MVALLVLLVRPAAAQVKAEPAELDFGRRGHNDRPVLTLVLENVGTAPVAVTRIAPSCSCIQVEPALPPGPIPAAGKVEIKVSMGSGRAMGVLDKALSIATTHPGSPVLHVPVHMRVFEDLEMKPGELHFDGAVGGPPISESVVILRRRKGGGPPGLAVERILDTLADPGNPGKTTQRPSPHWQARVVEVPEGKRLEVTLLPSHPEGRIWATLEAKLEGKLLVVPLAGTVFRGIKVVPNQFNFSRVAGDDPGSHQKELKLTATDGRPFRILAMTPSFHGRSPGGAPAGARLEVEAKGGRAGEPATEHVLRATIAAGAQGGPEAPGGARRTTSFSGTVAVKTDHPEKPELSLSFFGFFDEARKK